MQKHLSTSKIAENKIHYVYYLEIALHDKQFRGTLKQQGGITYMKVQIAIPIDLRLDNTGNFLISKQVTDANGNTSWQTLYTTNSVAGGEYTTDLEPGEYQKTLESPTGSLMSSSTFRITEDGKYVDESGEVFTIADDGKLTSSQV